MENWQEQHSDLKGDVTQLAAKMDKVLELLAAQNQPPPPVVNVEAQTTEPTSVVWPAFGLPPGYALPGYVPLADGATPANNTENQTGATLIQPRPAPAPLIQEDPKEVDFGEPVSDFAIPQLEEAKQKFRAIEDRLKTIEGDSDSLNFADMCVAVIFGHQAIG
jgi:hypothetical protein